MDAPGFSKVIDLEDEEDARQNSFRKAKTLYNKAQEAYRLKGSNEDVLQLFREAEALLAPLMECGLMGLREKELEVVLKGRLHQAVMLASLEDHEDRWVRVKILTEDVLQFDFNNCHARWLRGLALLHSTTKRKEAEEEMNRAVECARGSGKNAEAEQWLAEIKTLFSSSASAPSADGASSSEAPVETASPAAESTNIVEVGPKPMADQTTSASAPTAQAPTVSSKSGGMSGMQKGFFNRKTSPSRTRGAAHKAPAVTHQSSSSKDSASCAEEQPTALPTTAEMQLRDKEIAHLRKQLLNLQEERQEADSRRQFWQQDLLKQLEAIGGSLGEAFEAGRTEAQQSSPALQVALHQVKTSALDMKERLQGDRTWSEGEHQSFIDCSTEIMTLRQMTSRELKERQDTSKQQNGELKELTKRLNELKPSVKVLRDRAKKQALADGKEDDEPDLQSITSRTLEFRALPAWTKLAAFVDDAAVLRLMALAMLFGALVMLAIIAEVAGHRKCRFVCAGW